MGNVKRTGRIVNGRLKQVGDGFRDHRNEWHAVFECECGNRSLTGIRQVMSGHTKSCGCWRRDEARQKNKTHGHAPVGNLSPAYRSWRAMKKRCAAKQGSHHWKYYTARGITYCERWEHYELFLEDMGERPVGTTLDRINNATGYFPGNCRWATKSEQAFNRRKPQRRLRQVVLS